MSRSKAVPVQLRDELKSDFGNSNLDMKVNREFGCGDGTKVMTEAKDRWVALVIGYIDGDVKVGGP